MVDKIMLSLDIYERKSGKLWLFSHKTRCGISKTLSPKLAEGSALKDLGFVKRQKYLLIKTLISFNRNIEHI